MVNKIIPLEILKVEDIRRFEKRKDELLSYYYKHYSYFQDERSKILEKLKDTLNKNCCGFSFQSWHRIVSFKFSDSPLSAKGSLLNTIGGRFNIGDLDEYKFSPFAALYIAEDFETAYREKFQIERSKKINGLTADELALNKSSSMSDVVVEGKINTIIDLTKSNTLTDFYNAIKHIKLPKDLEKEAKKLKIPVPYHVSSLSALRTSILNSEWRELPMQVDIPSNSQIFGQIAYFAKIEAILYYSRMDSRKKCLAVFVENFRNSPSFVRVKDATPNSVKITCLDSKTFNELL